MLTVVQIRALKPKSRPYRAFDSDGLFLLVQPSGSLLWRFRGASWPRRTCQFSRGWPSAGSVTEGQLSGSQGSAVDVRKWAHSRHKSCRIASENLTCRVGKNVGSR